MRSKRKIAVIAAILIAVICAAVVLVVLVKKERANRENAVTMRIAPYGSFTITNAEGRQLIWKDGKLSINYTADKLNIDFDIHKTRFKFTPGSVELIVNQLPRVEIEYTGEPIYFPASANPNYQG